MLVIGLNGTPSAFIIKEEIYNLEEHCKKRKLDFEYTLTSYCKDLSLFNYMKGFYESDFEYEDETFDDIAEYNDDPYLPDFLYEIQIAYTLYTYDAVEHEDEDEINRITNEYKKAKKFRLNKMIEEGKPYNI